MCKGFAQLDGGLERLERTRTVIAGLVDRSAAIAPQTPAARLRGGPAFREPPHGNTIPHKQADFA